MGVKNESVLYETLLSLPSMGDTVKFEIKVPRKMVLILAKLIETGLSPEVPVPPGLLQSFTADDIGNLKAIPNELLHKAGLADFNEKLKALV